MTPDFTMLTVRGEPDMEPMSVLGEPTEAVGLFITPRVNLGRRTFSGGWLLIHGPSGRRMFDFVSYRDPEDCRELARRLAKTCGDWTGLSGDDMGWPSELRRVVGVVLVQHLREVQASTGEWVSRHDNDLKRSAAA